MNQETHPLMRDGAEAHIKPVGDVRLVQRADRPLTERHRRPLVVKYPEQPETPDRHASELWWVQSDNNPQLLLAWVHPAEVFRPAHKLTRDDWVAIRKWIDGTGFRIREAEAGTRAARKKLIEISERYSDNIIRNDGTQDTKAGAAIMRLRVKTTHALMLTQSLFRELQGATEEATEAMAGIERAAREDGPIKGETNMTDNSA